MRDTPCPNLEADRERIAQARAAFIKRGGTVTQCAIQTSQHDHYSWAKQAKNECAERFGTPKPKAKAKSKPKPKPKPKPKAQVATRPAPCAEVEAMKQRTCEIDEIFERLKAKEAAQRGRK